MRHPFDGIIIPDADPRSSRAAAPGKQRLAAFFVSRRAMLGWIGTALGAPLVFGGRIFAADKDKPEKDKGTSADAKPSRSLHYVVPKDGKKLPASTLKSLEINNEFEKGWPARPQYEKTPGYWAWIDDAAAEKIRQDASIDAVEQFQSSDILEIGKPPLQGTQGLLVELAPNCWRTKPKRGTYQTSIEIARQWIKDSGGPQQNLSIRPAGSTAIKILSAGPVPDAVLSKVREHPQTAGLKWDEPASAGPVTTQALGEEGGATSRVRNEEGGVTTRVAGEEGGATSRLLGEEGSGQYPLH